MELPLTSLTVKAVITRDIAWNSFPGSVIHGVLGYNLKELTCVASHRNCGRCFLVADCPYGMIYESPLPTGTQRMRLYPQSPHPLRLTIDPWNGSNTQEGECFTIGLTLFGRATTCGLLMLLSLEKAFQDGLGRKYKGDRGHARIIEVRDDLSGVSHDWGEPKNNFGQAANLRVLKDLIPGKFSSAVKISFQSPTKIITNEKVNFQPTVRDIVSSIMRRLGNLVYFHGGREMKLNYEAIIAKAENVSAEYALKRVRAVRYSGRQEKKIDISGIAGEITITNCPDELAAVLYAGHYIGIGKGTTMGLGEMIIMIIGN